MIANNLRIVKDRIAEAALKAGRSPAEIKLVAVSKRFPAEAIQAAFAAGQRLFGENYIQEIQAKRSLVPAGAIFHFIGHLQSNKAKTAAETCAMVETVDSFKLARALDSHLDALARNMDILVQINIGRDPHKTGAEAEAAEELLIKIKELRRLRVCGLMTMPPLAADPEQSRPHFRHLRQLAEYYAGKNLFPDIARPELSMGMSDDFHIAIDEGSTIVRVGTAIFGQRTG